MVVLECEKLLTLEDIFLKHEGYRYLQLVIYQELNQKVNAFLIDLYSIDLKVENVNTKVNMDSLRREKK